jgi:MYXO-CTERM domain-containing protein
MEMLTTAVLLATVSGYGDAPDGFPSWEERELHLYTNAVRVDPEAFEEEYNDGGCSFYEDFSADEQTPKDPVYYSYALNDAARYHSQDMDDSGNFSHTSSDGTSFGDRLSIFYPESGYVGENIAWNYQNPWHAVMQGWMCSTSGHRANIMSGSWNELGVGIVGAYYTQDFGGGAADSSLHIRMGVHTPQRPSPGAEVTFYTDWGGPADAAPSLVLGGEVYAMDLEWGTETAGVYLTEQALADGEDCLPYYFVYDDGGETVSWPEEGAYYVGAGCEADWGARDGTADPGEGGPGGGGGGGDDTGAAWGEAAGESGADDVSVKGCASAPSGASGLAGLLALLGLTLVTRRRE